MSYIPDGFKYIKDLRYIFYKDMPKPQYGIVFPYTKYPDSEKNGYNYVFEKPKDNIITKNPNTLTTNEKRFFLRFALRFFFIKIDIIEVK